MGEGRLTRDGMDGNPDVGGVETGRGGGGETNSGQNGWEPG